MKPGRPNKYLFGHVASFARNKTTLDIGCGNKVYSRVSSRVVTLDGWDAVKPDHLVNLETDDLPFGKDSFECVLMLDFIEHISRPRGDEILAQAMQIASGRIYALTPLWWDDNHVHTNDPNCWAYGNGLNVHKSLWARKDFQDWHEIGFRINDQEYFFGYWEKSPNDVETD